MTIEGLSIVGTSVIIRKFEKFVVNIAVDHGSETFTITLAHSEKWKVVTLKKGVVISHLLSGKTAFINLNHYVNVVL